jgi:hypothetical protein
MALIDFVLQSSPFVDLICICLVHLSLYLPVLIVTHVKLLVSSLSLLILQMIVFDLR